jgi:hypothetical protein
MLQYLKRTLANLDVEIHSHITILMRKLDKTTPAKNDFSLDCIEHKAKKTF